MNEKKDRKITRLPGANYNISGVYFITICTLNRQCLLSEVVGTGVLDGPKIELTKYGEVADGYIRQMSDFYNNISVKSYVIMSNHIHIMLNITQNDNGPSRTPVPTTQNSRISQFISTFKRFCNKEYVKNIWQYRSYDHIIRSRKDYEEHLKYINENPIRWIYDELYSEEK